VTPAINRHGAYERVTPAIYKRLTNDINRNEYYLCIDKLIERMLQVTIRD